MSGFPPMFAGSNLAHRRANTGCRSDAEHMLGERAVELQFRRCSFRKFDWWQRRGNNTRAKFGSSSGQSRGGDDWEISSSAGGSVLNDGKGARPTHQRTIGRPGWLQARSVQQCHALENHADDYDIKVGKGFVTTLRQPRSFLDTKGVHLTE